MSNTLKVLKFFVDHKESTITINKVAKALRMNYRIVYEEVLSLEKENILRITKIGNANICQFKYKYNSKVVEIEDIRKEEVCKNKDIALIYKRMSEIKNPFYVLILFGSYANKSQTRHSDIDLCLITDNKIVSEEVNTIVQITPLKIQLQEFSSQEFQSMLKSKQFNVGNEIVKNNIIVHGLETFYELVNNAV